MPPLRVARASVLSAVAVGLGLAASCRGPTQIVLELRTDVRCADVRGTALTVGPLAELEVRDPIATTTACAEGTGRIGSLVVVPSEANDDAIAIRTVLAFGRDPSECQPPGYGAGCVVARRALRFIPGQTLTIPVLLSASCSGIPCEATQTCVGGGCTSAEVDPNACARPEGCSESDLVTPAPTADAATTADATTTPDATLPDASAPDAQPVDASLDSAVIRPPCNPSDPTLILCYRFDGSVQDASGSAIAPSLMNNVTFGPGRFGSAARFRATPPSDLRIANTAALRAAPITFETWFNIPVLPTVGRMMLIDLHDEAGVMVDAGGRVRCRTPDVLSTALAVAGRWHHAACVFDGTFMNLYLDGVFQARAASSYGLNTTSFTGIGQESPSGGDRLDGWLDELRIWNVTRTPGQIAAAAR